jgi:hypothetical protein
LVIFTVKYFWLSHLIFCSMLWFINLMESLRSLPSLFPFPRSTQWMVHIPGTACEKFFFSPLVFNLKNDARYITNIQMHTDESICLLKGYSLLNTYSLIKSSWTLFWGVDDGVVSSSFDRLCLCCYWVYFLRACFEYKT